MAQTVELRTFDLVKKIRIWVIYRWITGHAPDTTFNQWKQICYRTAQVIVPRTLPLLLIKVMKCRSLDMTPVSINLGAPDTVNKLIVKTTKISTNCRSNRSSPTKRIAYNGKLKCAWVCYYYLMESVA